MRYHICLSKGLAVMAAALFLWGCGKANSNAAAFGVSGHPANWLDKHRPAVLGKGTGPCQECHGADLLGGIAKTSCAKCHALPPFDAHPDGWDDPTAHGAAAKLKPSLTPDGINKGFKMCQSCHGADFNGGVTNPKTNCFDCHDGASPHPTAWLPEDAYTHTNTHPANASVCARCHRKNPGEAGCFNNTLCHGNIAPHAFPYPGSVHSSVAVAPFSECLACHTNSGGVYPVPAGTPPDCRGCHKKASPGNGCGSCHGPLANGGRPNGAAFPNVEGHHNETEHVLDCTTCHGNAAGSGQPTHGPSNRTAHNDANVVIDFTGDAVGTVFTRTGNGHGTCSSVPCHESSESRTW